MFAIAAQRSCDLGYNGYMYGMAKSKKLLQYYTEELGAKEIGGLNVCFDEKAARELIKKYNWS
jgi:hypothetical protein